MAYEHVIATQGGFEVGECLSIAGEERLQDVIHGVMYGTKIVEHLLLGSRLVNPIAVEIESRGMNVLCENASEAAAKNKRSLTHPPTASSHCGGRQINLPVGVNAIVPVLGFIAPQLRVELESADLVHCAENLESTSSSVGEAGDKDLAERRGKFFLPKASFVSRASAAGEHSKQNPHHFIRADQVRDRQKQDRPIAVDHDERTSLVEGSRAR